MTIYDAEMDISVSDFKARCLDLIRRVEKSGRPIPIKGRGRTAARLRRASAPGVLTVLPLDVEVVIALGRLPGAFHGDPADRLIAATARAHRLPLATHDERIRKSRAVRLWTAGRRAGGLAP